MDDKAENNVPQSTAENCSEAIIGIAQGIWYETSDPQLLYQHLNGKNDLEALPEILQQAAVKGTQNIMERPVLTAAEVVVNPALPALHIFGNVLYDRFNPKS